MIKVNGSYVSGATQFKLSGAYSAVTQYIKSGGVYSSIGSQTLVPFTIGTLDFGMASLDAIPYGPTYIPYAKRMLAADGLTSANVICDALGGSTMATWTNNVLPNILARSTTPNMVVSLANPLGNDVSNAVSTYGRAADAPDSYWTNVMALLANGVAQLKAAGFKVIVGNTSYRNYGRDNSCRTDEDKGTHYANRVYLEPWIKANMPECWNNAADRPMLDHYNYIWNLGDWALDPSDGVHHTALGMASLRRYNHEVISAMSRGELPVSVIKRSWPDAGISSSDVIKTITGFGFTSTLDNMPVNINKGIIPMTPIENTLIGFPAQFVNNIGGNSPIKLQTHGWYGGNSTGRGNTGDSSVSLTNDALLKGFAYIDSNPRRNSGYIEIGGLTPFGKYTVRYTASAAATATVGDKVSQVRVNSSGSYKNHVSDEASPSGYLTFTVHADALGYIQALVVLASGGAFAYISGIEVESAA